MFETSVKPLRWMTVMKRVCVPLLTLYLIIGAISAYRAWYQIRRLSLSVSNPVLRPGSAVDYSVVSYARTTLDVRVELIQGAHTELIGTIFLRGNDGDSSIPAINRLQKQPSFSRISSTGSMTATRSFGQQRLDASNGRGCLRQSSAKFPSRFSTNSSNAEGVLVP